MNKMQCVSLSFSLSPKLTQCVKVGLLIVEVIAQVHVRLASMLLLKLPCDWVTVAEDEVDLAAGATFIWPKHDGIRRAVIKLALACNKRMRKLRIHPSAVKLL